MNIHVGLRSIALLFCAALCARAQPYVEITGQIQYLSYRDDDTNAIAGAQSYTISFTCIAGTNDWRIEDDFIRNGENKWHFDGTNVYSSSRQTQPSSGKLNSGTPQPGRPVEVPFEKSNLTIQIWESGNGHPLATPSVNLIWLAFCSGNYLKREGRIVPLTFDMLHHTRDRFGYRDKTATFDDALGLPRSVDLFSSKALLEASENDFDEEHFFGDRYAAAKKRIVANLPEGVLTFHYAATATTNFLGRIYPMQFEFLQNGRKYEQNGNSFYRGTGKVNSIRACGKPEGLFEPARQQTVLDSRFRDQAAGVGTLIYTTTNSFAPPTNDPALQAQFRQEIADTKPLLEWEAKIR